MNKKILVVFLAAIMSLSLIACGDTTEENDTTNTASEETVSDESKYAETDDSTDSEEDVVIELVAGEQGKYGKQITMSAGTDMEESFYVYYVPSGAYTVMNKGKYMTQVSVYEGIAKNDETGYDEYTNTGDVVLLDAGEEASVNITEGWFIEIQEPAHVSLTPVNSK